MGKSHRIPVNLSETGDWVLDPSPLPADWLTLSLDVILPMCFVCRIATRAFGGNELVIL